MIEYFFFKAAVCRSLLDAFDRILHLLELVLEVGDWSIVVWELNLGFKMLELDSGVGCGIENHEPI